MTLPPNIQNFQNPYFFGRAQVWLGGRPKQWKEKDTLTKVQR